MSMCGAIAILLFTRILNEIVEWNGQVKCLTVERSHRFESFLCHFHWDFGNTHHDDIFLRQKKRYEKDTKILLNISLYCFQDSKMWLANKKSSWKKKKQNEWTEWYTHFELINESYHFLSANHSLPICLVCDTDLVFFKKKKSLWGIFPWYSI